MVKDIRVLALDIDGVLTDGTGVLNSIESYEPRFDFHDLDAVTEARRCGLTLALVTGEDTDLVDRIAKRFGVDHVMRGAKDKVSGLQALSSQIGVPLADFCYVGDSDRDAPAFSHVGLGLAPLNATAKAKAAAHRILPRPGGAGAVAEAVTLLRQLKADSEGDSVVEDAIRRSVAESVAAHQSLLNGAITTLAQVTRAFVTAIRTGHKILLFGNGGSAADAQHVAAELVGRFAQDSDPWAAIALTTDTSVLTCVGNDWEYAEIFSRQVRALARPSDVVVGISTSGRSPNVIRGLQAARDCGALTIGFTGAKAGPMVEYTDLCFCAPAQNTPRIQELHLLAWHAVCEMVEQTLTAASVKLG
jgi:D-sedoheptulose 7-phosphate isomerase